MYKLFIRNWWRRGPNGQLVPNSGGRKTTAGYVLTEDEARRRCKEYNDNHKPGALSRKMEYTKEA